MSKIKSGFLIVLLGIWSVSLLAQNNTNSPYSRYGYGQLMDQAFAGQRGMGGIGYGLRNSKMINPLNPASFSGVDSMTFMLDLGVSAQLGWFKDPLYNQMSRKTNGNLEYIAMQFPLSKSLGMGLGFKPVSSVGYMYGETLNAGNSSTSLYTGSGGSNLVYGALSYNFFQRFSLGVNVSYLFGDLYRNAQSTFSEPGSAIVTKTDTLRLSGFYMDAGFQYTHPIGEDQWLIIGGVYTPKIQINGSSKRAVQRTQNSTTVQDEYESSGDYGFDMPESYGVGVTYNKRNKLMAGADFLYQKWADAEFYSRTDTLANRMKISLGGEYIPDARGRSYMSRVRYRAGMHYSDSYLLVGKKGFQDYGVSVGLGFPIGIGERSFLNVSFDYSYLRPEVSSLIKEQYFKFTLSYTFNELWFHKRKVQ